MVAVTYGVARIPATEAPAKTVKTAAPSKPWYVRFMNALIEARTQQAQREIARHIHLSNYTFDEQGDLMAKTGAKDLPFGGW